MKISKEQALENIRKAELTEFLMHSSDIIDPMTHIISCQVLQNLTQKIERSTLSELSGEP
jgi:hypothetical protein